jgi:hypothetical protein
MKATLNEAGKRLAESHVGYATAIAIRTAYRFERDVEELTGEAMLALTFAAAMYTSDFGVPFRAYAGMVMRHYLHRAIPRTRPMRPAPYPQRDGREAIGPPDDAATKEQLRRLRKKLPTSIA